MAVLGRLPTHDSMSDHEVGRRRERRYPVEAIARASSHCDQSAISRIFNLSPNGCMIDLPQDDWKTGQFISITLQGLGKIHAIIRWFNNGRAGIEFAHRIPDFVIISFKQTKPKTLIRRI